MNNTDKPLIYFWPENYPQKLFANYDKIQSPNELAFLDGIKWPDNFEGVVQNIDKEILAPPYQFIFSMKGEAAKLEQYDVIPNTFDTFLVNERTLEILKNLCPEDFQVLEETYIHTKDRVVTNYKLLNILKQVDCIDFDKSWCEFWDGRERIKGIKKLFFKPDCMKGIYLARLKGFRYIIIISQELAEIFRKEKIKGARFLTDQQSYNTPFPEEYLTAMIVQNPEAAKRYFVSQLNDKESYAFFKTRLSKIPEEVLDALIEMTLSRSSFHKEQCEEIRKLMKP